MLSSAGARVLITLCRYMNAEKYNLDRIYFGGYFIRGASYLCAAEMLRVSDGNDCSWQVMRPLSAHSRTLSDFGARARSGRYSSGTKASCKRLCFGTGIFFAASTRWHADLVVCYACACRRSALQGSDRCLD